MLYVVLGENGILLLVRQSGYFRVAPYRIVCVSKVRGEEELLSQCVIIDVVSTVGHDAQLRGGAVKAKDRGNVTHFDFSFTSRTNRVHRRYTTEVLELVSVMHFDLDVFRCLNCWVVSVIHMDCECVYSNVRYLVCRDF